MQGESIINEVAVFKTAGGLVIVIILMIVLVYLLRFLQNKKMATSKKIGRVHVSQLLEADSKMKLMVVGWRNTESLVAITPTGSFIIDQKDVEKQEKQDVKDDIS